MIDAASGGALVDKTLNQAKELITKVAANTQQFGSRQDHPIKRVNEVGINSIEQRLDNLTSLMQKFVAGNQQQVKSCGICSNFDHPTDMCPTLQDEEHLNAIQGHQGQQYQRKYDPFSATYNPGWRDHPNLSYGSKPHNYQQYGYQPRQPVHVPPPQGFQGSKSDAPLPSKSGISLDNIVTALATNMQQFQQETKASMLNLENQMSQLATTVGKLENQNSGRLPSQPEVNPKQNVSAITLRSGKELKEPVKRGTKFAGEDDIEKEMELPPANTSATSQTKSPLVIPPPFPSRLAKSKKEQ